MCFSFLSLQDQVQLGLIKDLRRGECRISGYAGTLQLARHTRPTSSVREPVWGERHREALQVCDVS